MTYVIITVDTEGFGNPPNRDCYYGEYDGEAYGIGRMMDICDRYNFPITFFLDIYEVSIHGEHFFRNLCKDIKSRGHDVQLHTHPRWTFDFERKREFMTQYDRNEQREIILWGCERISKYFGDYPISHRSGSYNFNYNTILALKEADIVFDNSLYHGHYYNRGNFSDDEVKMNVLDVYEGIIMAPVSQYSFKRSLEVLPNFFHLPINSNIKKNRLKYKKIDVGMMGLREFNYILEQFIGKTDIITFFMHSFSFMKRIDNGKNFIPLKNEVLKFELMMEEISIRKDLKVVTFGTLKQDLDSRHLKFNRKSFLPSYNETVNIRDIIKHPSRVKDLFRYRSFYQSQ